MDTLLVITKKVFSGGLYGHYLNSSRFYCSGNRRCFVGDSILV
ncbi:MAG: hypothetical protein AAB628_00185 [Patescibacteria group bacterium]